MDCITDLLYIDGLESCINAGADELLVGEVIARFPQDLKSHLVVTNGEGVYFGVFVFPYNILTRTQQRLKGEETLEELFKQNKYLASLNMSEDGAITVYTFSIVIPSFLG